MKKQYNKRDIVVRYSRQSDKGWSPKTKYKNINLDDEENFLDRKRAIPSSKFYAYWGSNSSINYRYLNRFLQVHVGQPFCDVYSKLCKLADTRSWAGRTWRDAIKRELVHSSPCVVIDDELFTFDGHYVSGTFGGRPEFYIDIDGVLRVTTPVVRRRYNPHRYVYTSSKKEFLASVKIGKDTFLIKSEGIWYEVETKDLNYLEKYEDRLQQLHDLTTDTYRDVLICKAYKKFFSERIYMYRWEELIRKTYCGELRTAISKKPAGDDKLQKYNLENKQQIPSFRCQCGDPSCTKHWEHLAERLNRESTGSDKSKSLGKLLALFNE